MFPKVANEKRLEPQVENGTYIRSTMFAFPDPKLAELIANCMYILTIWSSLSMCKKRIYMKWSQLCGIGP